MSNYNWIIIIVWPVVAILINNWLSHYQLKHMAAATAEAFNKSGLALKYTIDAIRDIEQELEGLGRKVPTPIDARGNDNIVRSLFK